MNSPRVTLMTLRPGPYADPTGHRVAGLMVKYAAPERVLAAAVDSVVDRPAVRAAYADDARTYPVHSPAAAWLSAAAYHDSASDCEKTAADLAAGLRRHGFLGEWARLAALGRREIEKRAAASAPRAFALSNPDRYPIDTPELVAAAVDYLGRHRDAFDARDRRDFATAVVKAAATLAVYPRLDDERVLLLEAEAGLGRLSSDWRSVYAVRTKLAAMPGGDAALVRILEKAAADPPADPAAAAADLRRLDRLAGWDLPEPRLVDETPTTAARKLAAVVESATGNWYRLADLDPARAPVPDAVLRDVVGLPEPLPLLAGVGIKAALAAPATAAAAEQVLADLGVEPAYRANRRPDWVALAAG